MDVYEAGQALRKQTAEETRRPPLIATGRKNEAVTTRRAPTREVSSRYKSPARAAPSSPRRCSSPNPTRTISTSSDLIPKRAQSVERNRPSAPSSPRPSTPVRDSSVDGHLLSRRTTGSRLQESLWPSTMRSLSVSFQSDGISVPVSKKDKPNASTSDRTLRPTSNVAHKLAEPPTVRKPTPERIRSPLKGKNTSDHSENSKPVDGLHYRLIDQHRWPSSIGGKASSNPASRSVDLADKSIRTLNTSVPRTGLSSLRRLSSLDEISKPMLKSTSDVIRNVSIVESGRAGNDVKSVNDNSSVPRTGLSSLRRLSSLDETSKPIQKSTSDVVRNVSMVESGRTGNEVESVVDNSSALRNGLPSLRMLSSLDETSKPTQKSTSDVVRNVSMLESGRTGNEVKSVNDNLLQALKPLKIVYASQYDKIAPTTPSAGSQPLPTSRSRPSSPSKTSILSSSRTRGLSPSRSRPSTPPSRGVSPSRTWSTSLSSQSNSSISVLSFIADFRNGKRSTSHIDDAHHLRLLYNRHLQWRFVNARAEDVLCIQTAAAEKVLFNVWKATLSLWDSVIRKRINLQKLKLELKLNSILNDHIAYLDDWALLERDHINALSGAIEDLEANTLRLPVTGRAKADMEHLKVAICSAVDVMQAMGSTICSLLSRVEGMNRLVFELAVVAAQEKAMLDECEALLASAAAMQVEENSLRTHFMQIKQALANEHG